MLGQVQRAHRYCYTLFEGITVSNDTSSRSVQVLDASQSSVDIGGSVDIGTHPMPPLIL
jgi:hypothetical protein